VDLGGVLVVEDTQFSDADDYRCTLYSPNDDARRQSFVVTVVVEGKCSLYETSCYSYSSDGPYRRRRTDYSVAFAAWRHWAPVI